MDQKFYNVKCMGVTEEKNIFILTSVQHHLLKFNIKGHPLFLNQGYSVYNLKIQVYIALHVIS